jgi:hypothetical protein
MTSSAFETTHTAVGQLAGYIFQPDRALVLLCSCSTKESVSIELVDDVTIIDELGNITYSEQEKHSVQANGQPFKDRSKDLWNTLMIWIKGVKAGYINLETTKLACVTNKTLDSNSIVVQLANATDSEEVDLVLNQLKKAAIDPPSGIATIISYVLSEEEILKQLIPKITMVESNSMETRNSEIAEKLHLTEQTRDSIIESLRGWFIDSVLAQLNEGKAPIIRKIDFNTRYQKAINKETDKRISFNAKKFVQKKITNTARGEAIDRTFIKQLDIIEHFDKHNIILDAIDDFLCSESERTRLTLAGDITKDEFELMDDESRDRWKDIFRGKMGQYSTNLSDLELAALAFEIYDGTIVGFLNRIQGNQTPGYLTRGSFHKLSDDLQIGWHPHWQKLFPNK